DPPDPNVLFPPLPPSFGDGIVRLSSGNGSQVFLAMPPPGGPNLGLNFRDFTATFTYPTPGQFFPSYHADVSFLEFVLIGGFTPFIVTESFRRTFDGSAELNVAATPLPAALPLLGTGLGFMGLMGWWRKMRSKAVA